MYDVVIVGGGPAGSTLARLIGKKYRVLLLEKRPSDRNTAPDGAKCCGGLIAPDAQLMLAKFGLGIPKSVLVSPQLFAVRTIDMDNRIERYYQRHYLNTDRGEFDKWLQTLIPAGVDIANNCSFDSFEYKDDHIRIRFRHNGKDYTEKTRLLVGGDGAFSKVRRQAFSGNRSPELYVSIQEWFEMNHSLDYYGAIFDKEITDFYSWTIPKENYLILGSALKSQKNANEKFQLLKKKLAGYGFDFKKCIKRYGTGIFRPTSHNQICLGNKRIALIGEAAGFISPSSAEGFSYAFRSSLALAKALDDGIEGCHVLYKKYSDSLKANIMIKNMKSPVMYNENIRKLVMKTGLLSINIENISDNTIFCMR